MTSTAPEPTLEDRPPRGPHTGRRVLFLGTHGQANIGDELLLDTFLTQMGTGNHYAVNSYDPNATTEQLEDRFEVTVFDTAGDRVALLRNLADCDVVVFGGGNILKELYRSVGRFRYSTLLMILGVVVFARAMRKPVVMANIGIGPVDTAVGRLLVRTILALVWLVSVRDAGSYSFARSLGCPERKVLLVPDAVWARTAEELGGLATNEGSDDGRDVLRVALNLNKDVDAAGEWSGFLDRLEEALGKLAGSRSVEFHALPMQCAFKEVTDLEVLEELLGRLDAPVRVHRPADHVEAARIISQCDVVVSERLHAIVLAAVVGRPVVALPYDVKVRELVDQLGIRDRSFDVSAALDPDALCNAIEACAEQSAGERARLSQVTADRRAEARLAFDSLRSWVSRPRRSWKPPGE